MQVAGWLQMQVAFGCKCRLQANAGCKCRLRKTGANVLLLAFVASQEHGNNLFKGSLQVTIVAVLQHVM